MTQLNENPSISDVILKYSLFHLCQVNNRIFFLNIEQFEEFHLKEFDVIDTAIENLAYDILTLWSLQIKWKRVKLHIYIINNFTTFDKLLIDLEVKKKKNYKLILLIYQMC